VELPWRDRFARRVACYQAGTSLMFYGWLTWLSPYYEGQGFPPERAGLLLAVWSIAQIPAALFVPALAERRRKWRFWTGLTLLCGLAGTVGALLVPLPPVVGPWLWAALMGVGVGRGSHWGSPRSPGARPTPTPQRRRAASPSASATPQPVWARC
jgi:CP family cyanate transporter-like MFS transporter